MSIPIQKTPASRHGFPWRVLLLLGIAWVAAITLPGCMNRPARHDRSGEVSYNRRELWAEQPGLFSGRDGTFTVYESRREGRDHEGSDEESTPDRDETEPSDDASAPSQQGMPPTCDSEPCPREQEH